MNLPTPVEATNLNAPRTLIVATAGHVDHGKTALVKHLTGTNTDTLAEEKSRGLTINLGYAYHHYPSPENENLTNTIGFVDVPGHTDFINNMLAGVGGVDAAMLVVAADDGIMPQTREHLAVLDLLGITTGLIVLTKIDRSDAPRIESVCSEIRELLSSTNLAGSPIFPVSNTVPTGIELLRTHLEGLPEQLNRNTDDTQHRRARYLIDRSFNVKGFGTVVTGSIRTGRLCDGDNLLYTQTDQLARLKSLRLDTTKVESAIAGQRVAANISLDHTDVERGQWLIDPALNHKCTRIDVKLTLLDGIKPFKSSTLYHLHIGASHQVVNIHLLEANAGLYQLKLKTSIVCNFGDRFVIRDPASSITLGGGKVIDTFVPRRQRGSETRISFLTSADQDDEAALITLLSNQPQGVSFDEFTVCRNINEQWASELRTLATASSKTLNIEGQTQPVLLSKAFYQSYVKRLSDAVASFHLTSPSQQGISETALSRASELPGSYRLFEGLLKSMLEQAVLKRTGTLIHAIGHSTALSREEEEFIAKIRPILLNSGRVPPRTRELVELTGIPLKAIEIILDQTTKAGSLVQVTENRHYLPATVLELAEFTEMLMAESGDETGFSVIEFRDKSEIGRNLCIEILEYFDSVGFTRRDGNSRFVRTAKENIFAKK
jgi:selenocysteine-specific elongation factor